MTRPIPISNLAGSGASGFEQPFEMLHACHERVERMLKLLERLRAHMATHGADDQARQAAREIVEELRASAR